MKCRLGFIVLENLRSSWKSRVEISVLSHELLFSERSFQSSRFLPLGFRDLGSIHREIFLTSIVHLFVVYAHFATGVLGTLM
jgi:hypothetical protein